MRSLKVLSVFIVTIFLFERNFGQIPANDPHWSSVWSDNFIATTPPSEVCSISGDGNYILKNGINYWFIDNNSDHGGEPQAYKKGNVALTASGVKFTAKKEDYHSGSNCTNGSVYKTSNGGTNWAAANTNLSYKAIFSLAVSGSNIFTGTNGGGVYKSTDACATWTAVNSGLPSNPIILSLGVNGTDILAGTYSSGIYKTSNGGTSWSAINTGISNGGLYVRAFAVSGSNIFAGTDGGVYKSTDGGSNWSAVNTGLTNTYVYALAISGSNIFAGTNGGGVFKSTDNGSNWSAANTGLTNTNVRTLAFSGSNLFAGTFGGGVFKTTDSGSNWSAVNSGLPTNAKVLSLAIDGSGYIYAGHYTNGIYKSTNGGSNWSAVNNTIGSTTTISSIAVSGSDIIAGAPGTSYPNHKYTSGQFFSAGNDRKPQYGFIEAKIKMSDTYGLWPAFWTWIDPSDYEEIDIFEIIPGTHEGCAPLPPNGIHDKYYMTSGFYTNGGPTDDCSVKVSYINDYKTNFHKYAIEWNPSKIIYYLDDAPFRMIPNSGFLNFDQQTNIILNLAMSHYVGYPHAPREWNPDNPGFFNPIPPYSYSYQDYFNPSTHNYNSPPSAYTNYSPANLNTVNAEMYIEYVKYYKLNGGANNYDCNNVSLTVTSSNYNTTTMDVIKKNLTTSGTISIPSGYTHKTWRASEYILIDNTTFDVPSGSELYLNVDPCY